MSQTRARIHKAAVVLTLVALAAAAAVFWGLHHARAWMTILGISTAGVVALLAWVYGRLEASLPRLEGIHVAPGLSRLVTVLRDDHGVPTVVGSKRSDLAWATGYLHAQERFFQMDLQRRMAAGELAELVGPQALEQDRQARVHRFRSRAAVVLAAMTPAECQILDVYVEGVNRGLSDLRAKPFEYWLLRSKPAPWTATDTLLTIYAMYLALQERAGLTERCRGEAVEALGKPLADFLFPQGTSWDSTLDGSTLPIPDMPAASSESAAKNRHTGRDTAAEVPVAGSNCFAVSGMLSVHGAAIVANDMHLALSVPNIWYRARLKIDAAAAPADSLDITGITLPGAPNIVAGSNGRIAWGYTNSCVDTSDVVILESSEGNPSLYRTPAGLKELHRVQEKHAPKGAAEQTQEVEESIWGPVIGKDHHGRKLALRWIAHDPAAVNLRGLLDLEQVRSTADALAIASDIGMPHQNLIVGDAEGNIGWATTNLLPRRFGHDGLLPASWADGSCGWSGYLTKAEMPTVYAPKSHRLWTANARVVGGTALQLLGFGPYAHGSRARQIASALSAADRFTEQQLLQIQLDDRGLLLERWQQLLALTLRTRPDSPEFQAMLAKVENWGGRATPDSVGYSLVRTFRVELVTAIYTAYTHSLWQSIPAQARQLLRPLTQQMDEPVWRLLTARPAHLVPPGYRDWDDLLDQALVKTSTAAHARGKGRLDSFTWGSLNRPGIRHPLSRALPILSSFLDPPDQPMPGDIYQPRVVAPGFGVANRFVVAPGHEAEGIFQMPTGQSGHPLSPYYNLGHEDWVQGRATAFLPAQTRWRLVLRPH